MIYNATPVEEIRDEKLDKAGVRLLIKREDSNHPFISGNKWWKLKYNIKQAQSEKKQTILTFGGAFSNHIYATAAAARENNLNSIGIIRGEETLPLNRTLAFAKRQNMDLHYISREDYHNKNNPHFHLRLRERFGDLYLIPEGGTNMLAVKGCAEFAVKELSKIEFDFLCLPVGTGGTMAGIISGLENNKEVVGISVLKNGDFLSDEIKKLIQNFSGNAYGNWSLLTSYHHGGYAKVTRPFTEFISAMKDRHNLPLDHVYTGKLMWAVMKEIEIGRFPRGSTVLVLHTGGLQGALIE